MYQIKLSTDKKYAYWIQFLTDTVKNDIDVLGGIFAQQCNGDRYCVCFAAETAKKNKVKIILLNALNDLFTLVEKRIYFINALTMRFCDSLSRDMLVNTLSHFNLAAEREYVMSKLKLSGDFNLDGFYNFVLRDLREEWRESAKMIRENADLVSEEESFNVILKFLLSGIEAQSKVISVCKADGRYILSGAAEDAETIFFSAEQLLMKLINIAPEKVIIKKSVTDNRLLKKLREIFCVREENLEKL